MALSKIETYFAHRQQQSTFRLRLYALVDGLLYARAAPPEPLARSRSAVALFDGTEDATLADAGPWLVAWDLSTPALRAALLELAAGPTGVSWLISHDTLDLLARALRERLDVRMPDGRLAWLRFHDVHAMRKITAVLTPSQCVELFAPTVEWWIQADGHLTKVHAHAA